MGISISWTPIGDDPGPTIEFLRQVDKDHRLWSSFCQVLFWKQNWSFDNRWYPNPLLSQNFLFYQRNGPWFCNDYNSLFVYGSVFLLTVYVQYCGNWVRKPCCKICFPVVECESMAERHRILQQLTFSKFVVSFTFFASKLKHVSIKLTVLLMSWANRIWACFCGKSSQLKINGKNFRAPQPKGYEWVIPGAQECTCSSTLAHSPNTNYFK